MRATTKFSLVITNYNRVNFLDRAIRSCTQQILFRQPMEIVVVDDGSTDGSKDILEEFAPEIRAFYSDANHGVAHASNVGLRESIGEYWMRVDADDYLNQYACAFMGAILDENPEVDFVYCDHYRVDIRGVKIEKVKLDNDETLREHGAGVMFRTERLRALDGYDESLANAEDWDLIARLQNSGATGYYLPVPLYRYYIHGDNITLTAEREQYLDIVKERHEGE